MASFIEPMLAEKTLREPFNDPAWIFETKYDGVRAQAHFDGYILDGEIVCFDKKGVSDWNALQHRMNLQDPNKIADASLEHPATFVAFDILRYKGASTLAQSLRDRRALLLKVPKMIKPIFYNRTGGNITKKYPEVRSFVVSKAKTKDGLSMYKQAERLHLEGIMAKELDSKYHEGKRTGHWLKIKTWKKEDFYIVGYTQGLGNRADYFGALVLMDSDKHYAGCVGTGLTREQMSLFLKHVKRSKTACCAGLPKGTVFTTPIKIPIVYLERAGANNTGSLRFPKLPDNFGMEEAHKTWGKGKRGGTLNIGRAEGIRGDKDKARRKSVIQSNSAQRFG